MFGEQLTALFWALPLVLLIGAGAILLLKRVLPGSLLTGATPMPLKRVGEPLPLSEHTTVHCVEMQGRFFIIAESDRNLKLEQAGTGAPHRSAWATGIRNEAVR